MQSFKNLKQQIKTSAFFNDPKYEKYRLMLIPALVLIVALLVVVLVTIPQVLKLYSTFQTIDQLNQKLIFYQAKVKELRGIDVQEYREDLDTALAALPTEKDIPGVMGEILVALGSSGMKLNGISFSAAPPESTKVEEFSITIDASGTQASLLNFLGRINIIPRLIKLTSVIVERRSDSNVNVALVFTTFYQSLPENIGAVDEKVPNITSEDAQLLSDIQAKLQQFPKPPQTATGSSQGKLNPFSP